MTQRPKEVKGNVAVTAKVGRRVCHGFTKQHFEAARYFANCAASMEDEFQKANLKDEIGKSQHRAYVVGAVVSATMAMETCINEIYFDACGKNRQKLKGLDEQEMALLAEWWPHLEKRYADTLLKYQYALLLLGKSPLPKGQIQYQDADNLIHLRNALTHYKPEWDDALRKHSDIQARLEVKFDVNPLAPDAHLWFPDRCLGSGCAKWAVASAEAFVSVFCTRLGIPPRTSPSPTSSLPKSSKNSKPYPRTSP